MTAERFRRLLLLLLLAAIALAFLYREGLNAAALRQWVEGAGPAAPLLFMAVYAVATVLFVPGSVLTLAGGALFGPWLGTFYNLTGATLGAALAFLAARHLASDWVARKSGGRLERLRQGVEKEGWRFVAFTRLVPLFPFNLLNYALGLTNIRFRDYVLASYLCMLPGAFAYTWLGHVGSEAAAGAEGVVQKGLMALALLAAVAFLPRMIARLRLRTLDIEQLRQRLSREPKPRLLDVRKQEEFDKGHIAGALNIPLETLASRIDELAPWRDSPLLLICTTDRRSRTAARWLAKAGFSDLQVVTGGMEQWRKQALPLETSAPASQSTAS